MDNKKLEIEIKEMDYDNDSQQAFLKDMLYAAIFVPEGEPRPDRNILELPEVKKYIEKFGSKPDDLCYIAFEKDTNMMAGAVWMRKFSKDNPSHGFVNEDIPELSIAVAEGYKGMGTGTKLLNYIINNIPPHIKQISLSVDMRNRAYGLYKKIGFENMSVSKKTATMVLKIIDN